jgi:thiamine biosynthesis lipoprotein
MYAEKTYSEMRFIMDKPINKNNCSIKTNHTFKHFTKIFAIFTIIIFVFFNYTSCSYQDETVSKTDFCLDTVITITLYNGNEDIIDECFEMCHRFENLFSRTIADSEISQINANSKNGITTTVSDDTIELLKYAVEYSKLSDGAFDITIGNVTSLWNFKDNEDGVLPDSSDIKEAVANIGYEQLEINGNDVLITNPSVSIDVGGLAKGYIADKLKTFLIKNGVKRGIINLGGNVLLIGDKPDKSAYNIGIQKPFGDSGETSIIINAKNISIVTSGIYERYFYKDNIIYHHILDTNTGYPIQNNLYSVTILSTSSVEGDSLSTSTFAMGLEAGKTFIENMDNVEAIFIDNEENIVITSGLKLNDGVVYYQ